MKIGRNDLCPCGSGKKYKKCCEKKDSGQVLDYAQIQDQLYTFGTTLLETKIARFHERYIGDENVSTELSLILKYYGSTIFVLHDQVEQKSIVQHFLETFPISTYKDEVKQVIASWNQSFPSVAVVKGKQAGSITVEDLYTKEVKQVMTVNGVERFEPGEVLLGTLIPVGDMYQYFVGPISYVDQDKEDFQKLLIDYYQENSGKNPARFVLAEFFTFILFFVTSVADVEGKEETAPAEVGYEWDKPVYEEIANEFLAFFEKSSVSYDYQIGLKMWNNFTKSVQPIIRNAQNYTAALVYVVDQMVSVEKTWTQQDLATEFNVSASSISSTNKKIMDVVMQGMV
ncbi:YecA family protein [Mangrovibacillus cuniculi]|uniref:SEC-C motif-containing protein n=1 Tax=Mangrovibacillus cuniculi TaxID=2593652 RepID=A0A7S8C9F2_9BACI|nr:SEC-C metal-binding domain-containing protein [Mangrovibacillus cuniculi]QPC45673.1 hypothetical protein G8O30_01145 [Mangrovibacillus cuniculi]